MARIKSEADKIERGVLNTTIDKEVLDCFKAHCKAAGLPMNTVIEAFMEQFTNGEFVLKIGKSSNRLDIED